jgi:predicted acyltransferase
MIPLVLVLVVAAGFVAYFGWNRQAPVDSRGERMARAGIVLTAVGVIWTVFAWWMVLPELVVLGGVTLIVVGRRRSAASS